MKTIAQMKQNKKKLKVVEYSKLENKVAALWTRVSTERQELNNCSLDNQKAHCREFAERHGIVIKKEFGGTHESAKEEGRLFKDMISEVAKDNEINIILVYSFDRFSRAGAQAIATKAFLKSKGIYVVSATQPIDCDSSAGEFMENMLFLFNQFENSMRRDKCVSGMRDCLRRGYWYGHAPLGYDRKKVGKEHHLTINEDGRKLKNAFKWKLEGVRDVDIVERLKAMGLIVDRKHLCKIFHNPFYCGYIKHNLLGEDIVQGKQEILIEESVFNTINGLSKAGYEHKEITEEFPLKRHVRCSDCGGYLTGYTVKARGRDYYKCNKKGCKSNHSVTKLHDKYVELLDGYKIPNAFVPILSKVLNKVFYEHNQRRCENHKLLAKQLTEIEQKASVVKIRYGLGDIPKEVYDASIAHLNKRKVEIQNGLDEVSKKLSNMKRFIEESIVLSCKLGDLWKSGTFESRQKLQTLMFPDGVLYDKALDGYRTENVNVVFEIFKRFTDTYKIDKEKATMEILQLPLSVG